jgi:predicted dehydrogenase
VIASDISDARRAVGERLGFARVTADWREVLADPAVEVVSITAPNVLHRELASAAAEAGKHLWIEKPVGRVLADTAAVVEATERAGVLTAVGFCYRFAPAVAHARELIDAGAIGEITHYRGSFMCDYGNRDDAAASWRFVRAIAGSGVLGDLMSHVVDAAHDLVGPIGEVCGRTATFIAQRPRLEVGKGTHFSRLQSDDLVAVDNEDWAAALFQFEDGVYGSLETSRVAVGPRTDNRFEIQGTRGAVVWSLERMNELQFLSLSEDGLDDGYKTIQTGPEHPGYVAFQPGAGLPMGYDDLRTIEAHHFLTSVRDGVQRGPGVREMLRVAQVLDAIERSHASGRWERPDRDRMPA